MPILQDLRTWAEAQHRTALPKIPTGQTMTYYQLQWPKPKTKLLDSRYNLDKNMIASTIRPLALGRKNSPFTCLYHRAERNAMMYSLMAMCKSQGIDSREWLEDTLQRIGQYPVHRLKELYSLAKK